MNGMSVRSRSGSLGFAAARVAASSTSGENSGSIPCSSWIRAIPSSTTRDTSGSPPPLTRTTRLLGMTRH